MADKKFIGWGEGATRTFCINKDNLECDGVIDLPRALGKDEPFISTNREKIEDHDAQGWIACPLNCGFQLWLAPKK